MTRVLVTCPRQSLPVRIEDLEKSLKGSKANAAAFSKTIKKLKADLESKTKEIADLQETVEKYKTENQNLLRIQRGLDFLYSAINYFAGK